MIAIDNAALISASAGIGIPPVNQTLFVAAATWAFDADAGAETLTVTDASTITSPDTFKKMNVTVNDVEGGTAFGVITTATGNTGEIDVKDLVLTSPLTIKVTATSTKGVQATGESNYVSTGADITGTIGYWEYSISTDVGA